MTADIIRGVAAMMPQPSVSAGPAARDAARRLRLQALNHELAGLGITGRLVHHQGRRWCLHLRGPADDRIEVWCAGAHGVYVLLTADGDLLACADDRGIWLAARQLRNALLPSDPGAEPTARFGEVS